MAATAGLVSKCLRVLTSFRPSTDTVDTHVANVLGKDFASDPDNVFVQQVFYGCVRMAKPLQVFLNALYHVYASSLVRTDYELFKVFAYMAIFRLDEITVPRFLGFVKSQELVKMFNFLSFLFDEAMVQEWVTQGWCKCFDRAYVEGTMLAALERHRPAIQRWLEDNHDLAFGSTSKTASSDSASPKASTKALTIPRAPNITQPKPPKILMPYRIPQGITTTPVPDNLDDVTLEALQAEAEHRRELSKTRILEKYATGPGAFKLHETRNTVDAARRRQEEALLEAMRPTARPQPVPQYPAAGADVRLNAAAILREESLLRARQAEDAAAISEYEACRRDKAEYYANIEAAKRKEEEERLAKLEQRRHEISVASKRAGLARHRDREEKAAFARALQDEAKKLLEDRRTEWVADVTRKREIVEAVEAMKAVGARTAKEELLARNRNLAAVIHHEAKAAEAERAVERAREVEERNEVIRQIRAIERVPKVKLKLVDPTSTSGMGFLDEMSLVELRERLAVLQAREAEEVETKRRRILADKAAHAEAIAKKVEAIVHQRQQTAAINREARAERKRLEDEEKAAVEQRRQAAAVALLDKLETRKREQVAEAERIRAEQEEISKKNMFLGAEKSAIEERRLASVFKAQERSALLARSLRMAHHEKEVEIAEVDASAAARRQREAKEQKEMADRLQADGLSRAQKETKEMAVADLAAKKEKFIAATEWRATMYELRDDRDPYTAAVRQREQEEARTLRGGIPVGVERSRALSARISRVPADNPLRHSMSMRLTNRIGSVATRGATPYDE